MKRFVVAVFVISTLTGLAFYVNRPKAQPPIPSEPAAEQVAEAAQAPRHVVLRQQEPGPVAEEQASSTRTGSEPGTAALVRMEANALTESIDCLTSGQTTYGQKRAVWKRLRDSGKLDQVIAELEKRAADDPRSAECAAALGQAYLQKCGLLQDVREQGLLALQADKVLDAALALDPGNWEARFHKAAAMSHWPPSMNRGDEVIQQFQTLIQQQESQAAQPQFAETYVRLGEQYQKAGRPDDARSVWERGAALFPSYDGLRTKLVSAQ